MEKYIGDKERNKYALELSIPEICKYIDQANQENLESFLSNIMVLLPENVNSVTVHIISGKEAIPVTVKRGNSEQEQGQDWGITELINYTLQESNYFSQPKQYED